jgi:hypothetical protein
MARHGQAWRGEARQGKGTSVHGGVPAFVMARHGTAWRGVAGLGKVSFLFLNTLQENLNYDFSDRHYRIEPR